MWGRIKRAIGVLRRKSLGKLADQLSESISSEDGEFVYRSATLFPWQFESR